MSTPATVTEIRSRRLLTPMERLECLMLAQLNEEKASLCTKEQQALSKFFEMNAKLLRSLCT